MKTYRRLIARVLISVFVIVVLLLGLFRLIPYEWRGQALHNSVRDGHTTQARLLVWLGCDPDFRTGSGGPLHYAAASGDVSMIRFLLRHGASVDSPIKFGITPLYEARSNHQSEAERVLLAYGANPDTSHINPP